MKSILSILAGTALMASAVLLWNGLINPYPVESFTTPAGKTLKIALIHHGSIAFKYRGYVIQVDPVSGDAADYSHMGKADAILITHEHGDHLNVETIAGLSRRGTQLYLNKASFDQTGYGHVITNGNHVSLNSHISLKVGPAYNINEERAKYHPKGNGNGYLLDFDGFSVYVSGDTEKIPEMFDIHEPDVAFLSANQPYTMSVNQCVQAALRINPKVLYPYHLSDTDMGLIKTRIEDSGASIDVRLFEQLR